MCDSGDLGRGLFVWDPLSGYLDNCFVIEIFFAFIDRSDGAWLHDLLLTGSVCDPV